MLVTEQQQAERLSICRSCPFIKKMDLCGKCGCFMTAKTKFKRSKCPIGKWGEIIEEKKYDG